MAALPNLAALLAAGSGPGDLAASAAGGNPLTPVADTGDATAAAAVNGCRTTPTPPSAGLLVCLSSWWVASRYGRSDRLTTFSRSSRKEDGGHISYWWNRGF